MQEYKYHWSRNGDQTIPEPIKLFSMGTEISMSEILPYFYRIFELTIQVESKKRWPCHSAYDCNVAVFPIQGRVEKKKKLQ